MVKSKHKGYIILQPLLLAIAMAIGILLGIKIADNEHKIHWVEKIDNEQIAPIGKVEEIIRYIDHKYVDSIDQNHLIEVATQAVINELDEYSIYIKSDSEFTLDRSLNGNVDGIGIQEVEYNDKLYIYKVYDNSSAHENGLKKGDQIIGFNGSILKNEQDQKNKTDWFKKAIIGDECELTIVRNFNKDTIDFKVSMSYGNFMEQSFGYMINDSTCYINIDQFSKDSYRRFMNHFERMYNEKTFNNLIIDVRNNTGGYVQEAVNIINQFFTEKDKLILTTVNKIGKETIYKSTGRNFFPIKKLVILQNSHSASASEILTGVAQDWDLATIIGDESYGKGLIQEQFPLINGDKIRLSVSKYITPLGRIVTKDSIEAAKNDTKIFKSRRLKKILHSGRIVPDIYIDKSPLEKLDIKDYVSNILDIYVFLELHTNNQFTIKHIETNHSLYQKVLDEINQYIDMERAFSKQEKEEILVMVKNMYSKHTEVKDVHIKWLHQNDQYIDVALDQIAQ